jgi:hypothetical protein
MSHEIERERALAGVMLHENPQIDMVFVLDRLLNPARGPGVLGLNVGDVSDC